MDEPTIYNDKAISYLAYFPDYKNVTFISIPEIDVYLFSIYKLFMQSFPDSALDLLLRNFMWNGLEGSIPKKIRNISSLELL